MADRVKFGRVVGWEVAEDVYEKSGIVARQTVTIGTDQVDALIDYLVDTANHGKYGVELEITLFESDEDKSYLSSGSLSPKFKKQQDETGGKAKGRSGGRRSL